MNMMNFLRSWIINIVSVVIFITFLEMLLPNSNMKKYIKMIIGLLVMIVILSPLLQIVHGNFNIEDEVLKTSLAIDQKNLSLTFDDLGNIQNQQVIKLYTQKIETNIKDKIEQDTQCMVLKVNAEIETSKEHENFGAIKKMNIVLKNPINDSTNKKIQTVSISPIGKPPDSDYKSQDTIPVIKKIKESISNIYQIDKDQIFISMHDEK
ncbi:stage III sporulation protein AF [Anaerophilus nitritogenes]|uniref:stage III sporulation protein AF n=1 Tax=Anaerophilus nitritogenes TaxID=2498136 RepID=UPI00101C96CD|nr:stage III sporulation protein AF [Anaerophilus nitritogenes]